MWETPSHTKESKQRHRKGKNSARIKEIAIFPYSILPRWILQKTFPQHNSDISQKLLWNNNGPFRKLTTDIKFNGAAVENILYAVKNIFQAMKHIISKKAGLSLENASFSVSHWLGEWVWPEGHL